MAIKLPARPCDDFVAWFPEKNGVFSVRSAYRLGLDPALVNMSHGQSSLAPKGDRNIWNLVWHAQVPHKLRVFAWKAATGALAVRSALHRRIPSESPICSICGVEPEGDHHALIRCTLAKALRSAMRKFWTLPPEKDFADIGKEWLLHLIDNVSASDRAKIIFLLWRVWHHRNNIVHGDGKASVTASALFLRNYQESFYTATLPMPNPKGKEPAFPERDTRSGDPSHVTRWAAPMEGWLKVNVDADWDRLTKESGLSIVVRDHRGQVLLSEWKHIPYCASAEEAEVLACLEGIKHLINLRQWPATLESDCLRAVQMLSSQAEDKSENWSLYCEARELLKVYEDVVVEKVERVSNGVAHNLAQLGKSGASGILWDATPNCVADLVALECNSISPN